MRVYVFVALNLRWSWMSSAVVFLQVEPEPETEPKTDFPLGHQLQELICPLILINETNVVLQDVGTFY